MAKVSMSGMKGRLAGGFAAAALLVGVPSAGLAVGLLGDTGERARADTFAAFTPASADPEIAQLVETRLGARQMLRFTPAGASANEDRAITVAVRVDDDKAQAISVRSAIAAAREPVVAEAGPRMATTRYNLGIARGYRSFAAAPDNGSRAVSRSLTNAAIPDLAEFEPTPGVRNEPSRLSARIAFEEQRSAASTAPETLDVMNDQSLDVAGSYRLTRNLDVTAGVRYEQQRDRASTLPATEQQDSQAVYVGTQFRF